MAQKERFEVKADCPTCGAPLDFEKGCTAVHCTFCSADHLVTGHGQTLSFFIPPRVKREQAVPPAFKAFQKQFGRGSVRDARLVFMPYYRLTGVDVRFREKQKRERVKSSSSGGFGDFAMQRVRTYGIGMGGRGLFPSVPDAIATSSQVRYQYVDKPVADASAYNRTFVAHTEFEDLKLYSLGAKAQVLKAELFSSKRIEQMKGLLLPFDISERQARQAGEQRSSSNVFGRTIIMSDLSLLYYPYWLISIKQGNTMTGTLVDGVKIDVTDLDVDLDRFLAKAKTEEDNVRTISFRPLKCPNCGWALPVRKDDIIFYCDTCQRTWELYGSKFRRRDAAAVGLPPGDRSGKGSVLMLPTWVLRVRVHMEAVPEVKWRRIARAAGAENYDDGPVADAVMYLPAYRLANQGLMLKLGSVFSNRLPQYELDPKSEFPRLGCCIDSVDAIRMTPFMLFYTLVQRDENLETALWDQIQVKVRAMTLLWFPYFDQGFEYVNPHAVTAVMKSQVVL